MKATGYCEGFGLEKAIRKRNKIKVKVGIKKVLDSSKQTIHRSLSS